jgi:DeoR/GlpR family transcriptional regulator of sugar metabolism
MTSKRTARRDQRHSRILRAVERNQHVEVAALAAELGVTEMTIRRDLATLDELGRLSRVHGGARGPRPAPYEARAVLHAPEKQALGKAAADLVAPGMVVGLDIGTTCHAVAQHLRTVPDLTVVCYSIHTATAFLGSECRVILLGGELTDELTLINGGVVDIAARVRLDLFLASCAGISPEWGITYYNPAEIEVRRALAASAEKLCIVADSSKLDNRGPFALGHISLARTLITNRSDERVEEYARHLEVVSVVVS